MFFSILLFLAITYACITCLIACWCGKKSSVKQKNIELSKSISKKTSNHSKSKLREVFGLYFNGFFQLYLDWTCKIPSQRYRKFILTKVCKMNCGKNVIIYGGGGGG